MLWHAAAVVVASTEQTNLLPSSGVRIIFIEGASLVAASDAARLIPFWWSEANAEESKSNTTLPLTFSQCESFLSAKAAVINHYSWAIWSKAFTWQCASSHVTTITWGRPMNVTCVLHLLIDYTEKANKQANSTAIIWVGRAWYVSCECFVTKYSNLFEIA